MQMILPGPSGESMAMLGFEPRPLKTKPEVNLLHRSWQTVPAGTGMQLDTFLRSAPACQRLPHTGCCPLTHPSSTLLFVSPNFPRRLHPQCQALASPWAPDLNHQTWEKWGQVVMPHPMNRQVWLPSPACQSFQRTSPERDENSLGGTHPYSHHRLSANSCLLVLFKDSEGIFCLHLILQHTWG